MSEDKVGVIAIIAITVVILFGIHSIAKISSTESAIQAECIKNGKIKFSNTAVFSCKPIITEKNDNG
jgi:hypothetical protein